MAYAVDKVDVWAGTVRDDPGGLAGVLSELSHAGAKLEFVIARRSPEQPGYGVVFVAPLKGRAQTDAARRAGLAKAANLRSVRIEGPDKAGLGSAIADALAEADINLRGMSGAALGRRSAIYLAFDNDEDASKARRILRRLLPAN